MSTQTQQSTAPPATEQGTHYFLITLQIPTGSGFAINTWSGTCTPAPGATRYDVDRELRDGIAQDCPEFARGSVLAFDLQPNQL